MYVNMSKQFYISALIENIGLPNMGEEDKTNHTENLRHITEER